MGTGRQQQRTTHDAACTWEPGARTGHFRQMPSSVGSVRSG